MSARVEALARALLLTDDEAEELVERLVETIEIFAMERAVARLAFLTMSSNEERIH